MAYVPEPLLLVNVQTQVAFSELIEGIRHADTDRELLIYMERFHRSATELRAMFTMLEGEALRKLREIRDHSEGGFEEAVGGLHSVPDREGSEP